MRSQPSTDDDAANFGAVFGESLGEFERAL